MLNGGEKEKQQRDSAVAETTSWSVSTKPRYRPFLFLPFITLEKNNFLENKAHTQDWSATAIIISCNAHMWWFYSTIAWFHMIYWKQHFWTSISCGTEGKTEPLTAHVTLHLKDLSLANAGFLRPMFGDLKSQYFGTGQHFVFLFRYMKHFPDICWLVIYSFMLCLTALRTAACCFCCDQRCCKQEGCRVPSGGQISTCSKGVSPISHLIFIC